MRRTREKRGWKVNPVRRAVSLLLCLCMVFTLLPLQVLAANQAPAQPQHHPFTDVAETVWYQSEVQYAWENGLFSGTGDTTFDPTGTMTRGMFVTVLARMAGAVMEEYTGKSRFSDVKVSAYYEPYVAWATEKGITTGTGGGLFSPDALVTRQQMAAFIVRFFETMGYTFPEASVTSTPKDLDSVADYAKDAVLKLWACGMLVGNQGNFDPEQNATRAQAAVFLTRVDKHLVVTGQKKAAEAAPVKPDSGGSGGTRRYTVQVLDDTGAVLSTKQIARGTRLSELPIPKKDNHIFLGWYADQSLQTPLEGADTLTGDLTLYAKYAAIQTDEVNRDTFVTKVDVGTDFAISITAPSDWTNDQVRAALRFQCVTDPEAAEYALTGGSGSFTFAGPWKEGQTYELTLTGGDLSFTGENESTSVYTFTTRKADVLNLQLSDALKFIPSSQVSDVTDTSGKPVESFSVPLATVDESGVAVNNYASGTFTYGGTEELAVGETVAVYEGTIPSARGLVDGAGADAVADQGDDGDVAYILITAANGTNYSYETADSEDVMFTPDILPAKISDDKDSSESTYTLEISKLTFTSNDEESTKAGLNEEYAKAGLNEDTTIDKGDFLAFYEGDIQSRTAQPDVTYGRITNVAEDGGCYILTYEAVTYDELTAAMDVYDTKDVTPELSGAERAELEASIEEQAAESGFVDQASEYLTALALQTDTVQSVAGFDAEDVRFMTTDGVELSSGEVQLMAAKAKVSVEDKKVKAQITNYMTHYERSGIHLSLEVTCTIKIEGEKADIEIVLTGKFIEEAYVNINVSGGAVWKKWWIFPYIADYRLNANIDVFNYTAIDFSAVMATKEQDEDWEDENSKAYFDFANEIKDQMEEEEYYEEEIEGGVGGLVDRYSAMLENESDWVNLVEKQIFRIAGGIDPFHILAYHIELKFVIGANMNVSIGCAFDYEIGKRYNFSILLFARQSTNSTVNLVDEHYAFEFYVMGTLGLRAGLALEVAVGLFSTKLDSIGIEAEVGAYARLWGYFYYLFEYWENKPSTSQSSGALLVEVGIYLEISFVAQIFNGTFAHESTLYENEWPLWSVGKRQNVFNFSYPQEDAPTVVLKKVARTYTLPNDLFVMSILDLKEGEEDEKQYNGATDFEITSTNPAFSYNAHSNLVTVTPPAGSALEEGELILRWKNQPLSFTSVPLTRTVSLRWDDLKDSYAINFETAGGSAISTITGAYNAVIVKPGDPTRLGYVFGGWYKDEGCTQAYPFPARMPAEDVTLYAKWTPGQAGYTVEHYQEQVNGGYELWETDKLTGTTGATVTPAVKTYEGFTQPAAQSITVAADGSTLVRYDYARMSYTLTVQPDNGGENIVSTVKCGAAIPVPAVKKDGFTFKAWSGLPNSTMPARDVTCTAQWEAKTNIPYTVRHYLEDEYGRYVPEETQRWTGSTDAPVKPSVKSFDGYVAPEIQTATVAADGSTLVRYQYARTAYDLHFDLNGGAFPEGVSTPESLSWGKPVVRPADPTRVGHTFAGWYTDAALSSPYTFGAMPQSALILYADWGAKTPVAYRVEHFQQALDGTYPETATETQSLTTTNDALTLTPAVKSYAGFSAPAPRAVTVNADGTTVVRYEYTRSSYKVTWKDYDGSNFGSPTDVKFGAVIIAPSEPPARTGYTFGGWGELGTMGAAAKEIRATNWTANSYTVQFAANGSTGEMALQRFTYDEATKALTANTFTRTGYGFTGWNTAADGSGTSYANQASVQNLTADANGTVTLYARWSPTSYTITYDLGGGTVSGNPDSYTIESEAITLTNPTKPGYIFAGWTDGGGGAAAMSVTIQKGSTGDKTYTATWTDCDHTDSTEKPTCGADAICTICGGNIDATGDHSYEDTYQHDDTNHWQKCSVCETESTHTAHAYTDESDTSCSVCGYTRTIAPPPVSDMEISSAEELAAFATQVNGGENFSDKTVTLTADIDLSSYINWTPIGTGTDFKGTFDGGGHTITGLTIDSTSSAVGLFGIIDGGTVQNLFLKDVNVVSSGTDVGALAGKANNGSTISQCAVTGTVTGWAAVGGLFGSTWTDVGESATTVENCFAQVTLNGTAGRDDTSGISGWNESDSIEIKNSYSACTGEKRPLAGCSDGAAVALAQISGSFYDKTLSEFDNSDNKNTLQTCGKTTEDLKTQATFTGWDFDTIWVIDTTGTINGGYPYLRELNAFFTVP